VSGYMRLNGAVQTPTLGMRFRRCVRLRADAHGAASFWDAAPDRLKNQPPQTLPVHDRRPNASAFAPDVDVRAAAAAIYFLGNGNRERASEGA
jgi:hypothetical protein